mmetsp:Transcript_350/g.845  ORF Transcript_350/g.845 Transcript_350/m.845 type:complete len:207 (-) Transcript_350:627-1247(-)
MFDLIPTSFSVSSNIFFHPCCDAENTCIQLTSSFFNFGIFGYYFSKVSKHSFGSRSLWNDTNDHLSMSIPKVIFTKRCALLAQNIHQSVTCCYDQAVLIVGNETRSDFINSSSFLVPQSHNDYASQNVPFQNFIAFSLGVINLVIILIQKCLGAKQSAINIVSIVASNHGVPVIVRPSDFTSIPAISFTHAFSRQTFGAEHLLFEF